ncbi:MAG TPA: fibrobacter succinogenes major paralogous domain-containing protein [Tenuifilaceae bacterium]|nr:fibrobacter succinogenes major paralogous domain-containing protein [Tenuifilaceae bacterium]
MKRLFFSVCGIVLSITLFAQPTQVFSYQAVVRNADNNLVKNSELGLRISIMQGEPDNADIYNELQTVTTNENGLLTTTIGNSDGFADISWTNPPYFLSVEIDLDGGSSYTVELTTQLLSVPFAMHAYSAESITGELNETDPAFTSWDKSTGISITEDQITDLKDYIETENQNLDDVLANGTDAGNKNITNLASPVNALDAATKEYVDGVKAMLLDYIASLGVTDPRDDRHYSAVAIGNQIWMAENLKYLPSVNPSSTSSNIEPCYYVYGYEGMSIDGARLRENFVTYGVLYNWPAAMNGEESSDTNPSSVQGVCPAGWHLPSDAEWEELIEYLGNTLAQEKLKESGNAHWIEPSIATNETGFTALPGGTLYQNEFINLTRMGYWWSATQESATIAKYRMMHYENYVMLPSPNPTGIGKEIPMSIRCVRD